MKINSKKQFVLNNTVDDDNQGEIQIQHETDSPHELFQLAQEERGINKQVSIKLYELAIDKFNSEISLNSSSSLDYKLLFQKAMCLKQSGHYISYQPYLDQAIQTLNILFDANYLTLEVEIQISLVEFMKIYLDLTNIIKIVHQNEEINLKSYPLIQTIKKISLVTFDSRQVLPND